MENLKELLGQIKLFIRFDSAVVDELDSLRSRVAALEEDNKRLTATQRADGRLLRETMMSVGQIRRGEP